MSRGRITRRTLQDGQQVFEVEYNGFATTPTFALRGPALAYIQTLDAGRLPEFVFPAPGYGVQQVFGPGQVSKGWAVTFNHYLQTPLEPTELQAALRLRNMMAGREKPNQPAPPIKRWLVVYYDGNQERARVVVDDGSLQLPYGSDTLSRDRLAFHLHPDPLGSDLLRELTVNAVISLPPDYVPTVVMEERALTAEELLPITPKTPST